MPSILVIEDDTGYRRNLIDILREKNYRILEAVDGLHGLEMIRMHSFDLIVCDLEMPIIDGIEVLKTVKSEPTLSQIPFIMVTGHQDVSMLSLIEELQPDALLPKPSELHELLSIISNYLRPGTA
jgi:two-component system, NtrC family, nitrogen regulation response regulator NtrX